MILKLKLNEQLRYFKQIILLATDRAWHYVTPKNESFPYLVWEEYSEAESMHANNQKLVQPIRIKADYYTQFEFDPVIDLIQNVMNNAEGITFELVDVLYEESTEVIHYSWDVVVNYGENDCNYNRI